MVESGAGEGPNLKRLWGSRTAAGWQARRQADRCCDIQAILRALKKRLRWQLTGKPFQRVLIHLAGHGEMDHIITSDGTRVNYTAILNELLDVHTKTDTSRAPDGPSIAMVCSTTSVSCRLCCPGPPWKALGFISRQTTLMHR